MTTQRPKNSRTIGIAEISGCVVVVLIFLFLLIRSIVISPSDESVSAPSQVRSSDKPPKQAELNEAETNAGNKRPQNAATTITASSPPEKPSPEKQEQPATTENHVVPEYPRTMQVHKIVSDENKTIGCPDLENLAGLLDLIASGQADKSGAYASRSGCIYLNTTHIIAMTGEYVYEHNYKDDVIPLVQVEIYIEEYLGTYWVMKTYFDHPDYTISMEKPFDREDWVRSADRLSAALEAEPLEQAKADDEQKKREAAIAARKVKFGEWEYESDHELGDLIYVYNLTDKSDYDTYFRLIYTCGGELLISGEGELSTQRAPMRFDNSEFSRRWHERSWRPGTIQLQRVPNPALQGNTLSIELTYRLITLVQEANITDVASFPIAKWHDAVEEYCSK